MNKCCNIYNTSFINDLKSDTPSFVSLSDIRIRMVPYSNSISGLWMPLWIYPDTASCSQSNLLINGHSSPFVDPCNCDPTNSGTNCEYCYDKTTNKTVWDDTPNASWNLRSTDNQAFKTYGFDPCGNIPGNVDIRANEDDITPKIPVLDNSYITGSYDFKYFSEFPARQCNPETRKCGLGWEQFIRYNANNSLTNFNQHPELCIDWKIIERIGEIPFDEKNTHHKDVGTHIKSYNKFLNVGKTCGNFIMLSGNYNKELTYDILEKYSNKIPANISPSSGVSCLDILPSDDEFTIPYGTKYPHYNNVFIGKDKLLSHWKWDYKKAIACWYRYSSADNPTTDKRPIPGVDLYISDGDVFWANNIGPEKSWTSKPDDILGRKPCPRGTKVVENGKIKGVIPNGSEFLYISKNIYNKFLNIVNRLEKFHGNEYSHSRRIEIAAILSTAPSYDEITLDLLDSNKISQIPVLLSYSEFTELDQKHIEKLELLLSKYEEEDSWRNPENWDDIYLKSYAKTAGVLSPSYLNQKANFQMLSKDNKNMSYALNTPNFTHKLSANNLNYIDDISALIKTLSSKYGSYLWIPPNTNSSIRLKDTQSLNIATNLDFDIVVYDEFDNGIYSSNFKKICSTLSDKKPSIFGYDQFFNISNLSLSSSMRDHDAFTLTCVSGINTINNISKIYNLNYNSITIGSKPVFSGVTHFQDKYLGPSYDLALSIDGEKLCSDNNICDRTLGKKYSNSNIYAFENNNIYIDRVYNKYLLNPNIDIVGFTNQGGMYCESNLFGRKTIFPQSYAQSDNKYALSFGFKTYRAGIKLYSLNIEHLRDINNLGCKTFPLDKPCNCESIPIINEFPYNCRNEYLTNGAYGTPNLSTQRVSVMPYGGRSGTDYNNSLSPIDLGFPGRPLNSIKRYLDPNSPLGCVKTKSITLPYYVSSTWNLELFPYNESYGDMWATISDGRSLTSERVQTKVNIGATEIFNNQFKRISQTNRVSVKITDPYLSAIVGDKQLYSPLGCAVGENTQNTKYVNITFKYIPRKNNLLFYHSAPQSMGQLLPVSYSLEKGLNNYDNTYLNYDNKLYTFGFNDSAFSLGLGDSSYFRFYSPITPQLTNLVNNLDQFDVKKLKLYLKINNNWYSVDTGTTFAYQSQTESKTKYIGYPLFFEYQGSPHTKKLKSFIPSFICERPNLVYFLNSFTYKSTELSESYLPIFTEQFYSNKTFSNFINIDGFRAYFFIKGLDDTDRKRARLNTSDPLIPDTFEIPSSLYIPTTNKKSVFSDTDTMICTEPCFVEVNLKRGSSSIRANITDKYLFKNSKGTYYTSFRLIPAYIGTKTNNLGEVSYITSSLDSMLIFDGQQGYIDFFTQKDAANSTFVLTSMTIGGLTNNLKNELDIKLSNKLYDHKWSDVNNFVSDINTFDLLNILKKPDFNTTYDNLNFSILKYFDLINHYKKSHVPFYISASGYDGNNNILSSNYTRCSPPSETKYTSSIHKKSNHDNTDDTDYYLPFIDINYFSKNQNILNSNIINTARSSNKIANGSVVYSGLFLNKYFQDNNTGQYINNLLNPHYNSGYFWLNLSSTSISNQSLKIIPNIFNTNFYDKASSVAQPPYLLKRLITTDNITATSNSTCTELIRPSINRNYSDSFNFSTPTSKKYICEPYTSYPIYCNLSRVNGCDSLCSLNTSYGEAVTKAEYEVISDQSLGAVTNSPMEYFIGYDNGLYSNTKYITRKILTSTNDILYPGISYDNDDLNNGVQKFPNQDISIYSKNTQNEFATPSIKTTEVNNLDTMANEMLFRLLNNTKQFINTDKIGRYTQEQFYKQKKLLSLKTLLKSSSAIDPSKVYELIPYDFDTTSDSNLRKIIGNINITGLIAVGHSVTISFDLSTLILTIEQTDDAINLVASYQGSTKKIRLKTIKNTSSSLIPVLKTAGTPVNTETVSYSKVGSCNIYGGKEYGGGAYFTNAIVNGVDILSEYKHCVDVAVKASEQGIYACNLGSAAAALNMRPVNGSVIVQDGCSFTSPCQGCTNRGVIDNPDTPFVAQSFHSVILGARATYSTCIGCTEYRPSMISGQPGGSTSPRSAPLLLDAADEGNADTLAGGEGLRNPIILTLSNCGYVGCGPSCLPINYSDKLGSAYLSAFNIGYRTPPPGQPCECLPYELGKCKKTVSPTCFDSCLSREYSPFSYTVQNGNYTFTLDGYKSRDKNNTPPILVPQTSFTFPDVTFLQFDWSAPAKNDSNNTATEACVWTEYVTPDTLWDIYEATTTDTNNVKFSDCPESFANIRFTNTKLYINETLCFDINLKNNCPNISINLPNNSYNITNSIDSECTMCDIGDDSIKIVDNKNPTWETITETRYFILGSPLAIEGDKNYTLVGGSFSNAWAGCCGPEPPPTCCGNRCLTFFGGNRQCGKSAPDSFPWLYCLECNIPGSSPPELLQAQGGSSAISYVNGGGVINCVPFSYGGYSSPQIKDLVYAEWKRRKKLAFNDFIPCNNNQNINLEDMIEGIVPGSCQLNFTTLSFPYLAFRRTYDGSESAQGSLGVHVAYITYNYKRPKTIDDILTNQQCSNYYIHRSIPPRNTPNQVEKYVNGGICGNEIVCQENEKSLCDTNKPCCRTGKLN